jgi:CMP-N,N'-diacetyllegionaminic acid synthase
MFVLGVIPARGGSKTIPRKNIYPLLGKPLIYYSIKAATESALINDCIVSTDDLEIKNIAESYGIDVPFLRPKILSGDKALAVPTIKHAVLEYEKLNNLIVDYVVMLQPTAPLRTSRDIDIAIEMLIEKKSDSLISVVNVDNFHPFKMKTINGGYLHDYVETGLENPPRQSLPDIFIVNGALYMMRRDVLVKQDSFKGNSSVAYVMNQEKSANIDVMADMIVAEYYLKKLGNEADLG